LTFTAVWTLPKAGSFGADSPTLCFAMKYSRTCQVTGKAGKGDDLDGWYGRPVGTDLLSGFMAALSGSQFETPRLCRGMVSGDDRVFHVFQRLRDARIRYKNMLR
jgi:hypothetical protein